jgi:hypothetical protein
MLCHHNPVLGKSAKYQCQKKDGHRRPFPPLALFARGAPLLTPGIALDYRFDAAEELKDAGNSQTVVYLVAALVIADDPCLLEDRQVLGDGRDVDPDHRRELANAPFAHPGQLVDDEHPRRVGHRLDNPHSGFVTSLRFHVRLAILGTRPGDYRQFSIWHFSQILSGGQEHLVRQAGLFGKSGMRPHNHGIVLKRPDLP